MTETGIYVLSTIDKEAEKLFADSPECWHFDRTDRPNTKMLSESDFILRCISEFIERVKNLTLTQEELERIKEQMKK